MKEFNIVQADWGIGDVICSLYAINSLAKMHPSSRITFFVRNHMEWAKLADIPQMSVRLYNDRNVPDDSIYLYSDKEDPDKRIKHTNSPKKLFASKLCVDPIKPSIHSKLLGREPVIKGDYILLSPFASRINRTWELHNWKILSKMFSNAGYKTVAVDGPFKGSRIRGVETEYYWGQSAEWTLNACMNAKLIIGNDSGIAHIGGWVGAKTLVVMTQLDPNKFYDFTKNEFLIPEIGCVNCQFLMSAGYEEKCDSGCWALQSIRPLKVFEKAIDMITAS